MGDKGSEKITKGSCRYLLKIVVTGGGGGQGHQGKGTKDQAKIRE